jgi:hypothetical protein
LIFIFWVVYNHKRDTRMVLSTREPLTKLTNEIVNMADISLTYYSQFLNHFAESRKLFPFEETSGCMASTMHLCYCLPVFLGQGIRDRLRFQSEVWDSENRIFQLDKTSPCASTHWAGRPLPGAGWRFGRYLKQYHQTQIKARTLGEKCHAIHTLFID